MATIIKHVQGNVLKLAIPLTRREVWIEDGVAGYEDTDFVPSSAYPVGVEFNGGKVKRSFEATMRDGNVAYVEDPGELPVGIYALTICCKDGNGNPYRFKQKCVVQVVDLTAEAGIVAGIEYETEEHILDAAVFMALTGADGQDGVGIADITTVSSDEPGGVNTVTFLLTDGRSRTFTVRNGIDTIDPELDATSQNPIANSAVTASLNGLAAQLVQMFGDVDYDGSSKRIRFFARGAEKIASNVLASIDASPFLKDETIQNVYISNNQLVVSFNSTRSPITLPLTSIFNPNNYYNRTQVDNLLANKANTGDLTDLLSGKVDKSDLYDNTAKGQVVKYGKSAQVVLANISGSDVGLEDGDVYFAPVDGLIHCVDVIETSFGKRKLNLPVSAPDKGLIYANRADGKTYLWNGSAFVETTGSSSGGGINATYDATNERLVFPEGAASVVGERLIINT